jgi:hypothetical protein
MTTTGEPDTSGKAFVEHWSWAAERGEMNPNTAGALRAACAQVLSALENWETVDIRGIDVEDTFRRFQNKRARDFKAETLETYRRRFSQAVRLFLQWAEDPKSWKSPVRERKTRSRDSKEAEPDASPSERRSPGTIETPPPPRNLMDYPFPLPGNRIAFLRLPGDLKLAEVQRLTAFLTTLAVDFDPMKGLRP